MDLIWPLRHYVHSLIQSFIPVFIRTLSKHLLGTVVMLRSRIQAVGLQVSYLEAVALSGVSFLVSKMRRLAKVSRVLFTFKKIALFLILMPDLLCRAGLLRR